MPAYSGAAGNAVITSVKTTKKLREVLYMGELVLEGGFFAGLYAHGLLEAASLTEFRFDQVCPIHFYRSSVGANLGSLLGPILVNLAIYPRALGSPRPACIRTTDQGIMNRIDSGISIGL